MAEVVQKFSSLCPKIYVIFRYLEIRNRDKISESHVGERQKNRRIGHLWDTWTMQGTLPQKEII